MKTRKNNQISAASVDVDLKPHLEDFLRHEMNCPTGPIVLTRSSDIGKYIYSHITTSVVPPKKADRKNAVTVLLPVTSANKHIIQYRFLFIGKWGEEKIQDYLEAEFRFRIRLLFEIGYRKRYQQKQIIESILQNYNIRHSAVSFDAVKKCDYRHNRKLRKIIFDDLKDADI